jgi:hypothetical protein
MVLDCRYLNTYTRGLSVAAGTIGAQGNNGAGVVGVCQRGVRMIPAKFMGTR